MNPLKYILLVSFLISSILANEQKEKISLQLLWKHQFEFAGFYMAKEKGFYDEVGLDVELKEFDFGIDITKDIESGKSTYGVNYPSLILDKAKGANVVLLSAILQSSPHALVSLKSSGIESIKDFKNKKVMLNNNAVKTASLVAMMNSQKVSFDEVKKLNHTFHIEDLIKGKTDLFTAFTSNEIYTLQQRGIEYNIWDPKDYGFDLYEDILFTSMDELKNNPKRVENFVNASIKGWEYAFNNIDETVKVILKKYNSQNKTKGALEYEAKILKQLAYYNTTELGDIDKNKIQRLYDLYNLMGLTTGKIDIEGFIYKYLKKKILLTNKEKEYLKNNPILTAQNEKAWAPINYMKDGKPVGYSVDYLNLIAQKLDVKIKYVSNKTWDEYIKLNKQNKLDIMLNIIYSKDREKHLNFTQEYLEASRAIFTNLKNIFNIDDLNGKTVAVTKNFYIHNYLKKNYPKIKLNVHNNFEDAVLSVIEGSSDAIIGSYIVINHIMKEKEVKTNYIRFLKDEEHKILLRMTTSKQNEILRDILQKAINSVTIEEESSLKTKWFGIELENQKINRYIEFSKKEKEYLKNKKSISMCIDPDWMPYEKFENDKHIGLTADYYNIFKKSIGVDIKVIKTKSWSQSLEYAKQRKCDILSLAMETENRKKYMNFTTPYLKVPLVLATKLNVGFVTDFNTLSGEKVAIPKGYAFVEILKKKYPNINIVEVKSLSDGLEQVNDGRVFGYIGTLASVGYAFQHKYTGELKIAGKFDDNWELGIAVRDDDPILLSVFQKVINNLDSDIHQQILNKWVSIKYEKGIDYQLIWQILAIVVVIISFLTYRQYLLKRSNSDLQIAVDEKTKELQELNQDLEKKIEEAVKENSKKDRMLFEQSKMASMGEMIGNIAHQWRQPLSVISTTASGIQIRIECDLFEKDEIIKNLEQMERSTQYLSATIDDFQNFLKPSKRKKEFNVKQIIHKNMEMFGKSFTNNDIKIIIDAKEDIIALGSENELLQVIINILNNAKDALKESDIEKKLIFISLYKQADQIYIDIKDNAGGIKDEILTHVFDAYFTTKHQSQGTGLGLYMSYQIITTSFGGLIEVSNKSYKYEDKSYKGARFRIILPIVQLSDTN